MARAKPTRTTTRVDAMAKLPSPEPDEPDDDEPLGQINQGIGPIPKALRCTERLAVEVHLLSQGHTSKKRRREILAEILHLTSEINQQMAKLLE